jgi:CNP1-like family protein
MRLESTVVALALAACAAHAQLVPQNPDWREAEAPPPALKLDGLIPLDVPGSTLRFGVAPASIAIGSDGIVRYVVVASSTTGTVNAIYEGIRCGTGEFKVYARHNPDSGWTPTQDAAWRSLHAQPMSRHSLLIARTGACVGHGANRPAARIVQDLRSPVDGRFSNETRP